MANLTFCRQDVEHSPFAVGNTRRNATLRNVSQSIFLRKEIALLRKVVGESACYTSIYVFDTKRRTTRFKVRKALNNKFVCAFLPVKSIEIGCLSNLLLALLCAKKIDRDPKVSESLHKIDSIHQNDSVVATRACAVATKNQLPKLKSGTYQKKIALPLRDEKERHK